MRGDGVMTRRTSLFLGITLAVLGNATLASAQEAPPPPPPAAPMTPPPSAQAPPMAPPPMMLGPSRLPYFDNEVVPSGYEVQTRPRMGVAKAGLATFIPLYGLSVLFGSVYLGSESGDAKRYGPMLIPIVGPFATIGTADTDFGTMFLVIDGIGQITGATLFIAGMLSEEKYLGRQTARSALQPEIFVSPKSIAMRWQF